MAMFRHILAAVDLSERSAPPVAEALMLAHASGARLTVLHVTPALAGKTTREDLLARLSVLLGGRATPASFHLDVVEGDVQRETLAFADAYDVDLIVVGGRPRDGSIALPGSAGDRITRQARCSVLTVREPPDDAAQSSSPLVSRILCAVDLTPASPAIVDVAAKTAITAGARLDLLHVVDPWLSPGSGPMSPLALDKTRAALEQSARMDLSRLLSARPGTGAGQVLVSFGMVGPSIVQTATAVGADLLVLGAHSKRLLGHTYLGSNTLYLRDGARCPVMIARPSLHTPAAGLVIDGNKSDAHALSPASRSVGKPWR